MARTTRISSTLRHDYSVEDLMFGNFHTTGIENFDVVNKLGCLSSLRDVDNRDPVFFSVEAMNNLADAEKFGVFAMEELQKMNDRFAICNEISKRYSVEGFNPLAFGAEGFGETMKKIGQSIVNGFKKLAATLMNFIRSVGNAIGSAIALTQVKLYEKNKDKKFVSGTGREIKALVHRESFANIFNKMNSFCNTMCSAISNLDSKINGAIEDSIVKTGNPHSDGSDFKHLYDTAGFKKAFDQIKSDTINSSDPNSITKFDPKKAVFKLVYGKDEVVKPTSINSGEYLTKTPDGVGILSRQSLEVAKVSVKAAQSTVKTINNSIKSVAEGIKMIESKVKNKYMSDASKDQRKETAKEIKASRTFMTSMNFEYRITTKLTTYILMTFAHFLRCRGYCAAAVKAYDKEDKNKKDK